MFCPLGSKFVVSRLGGVLSKGYDLIMMISSQDCSIIGLAVRAKFFRVLVRIFGLCWLGQMKCFCSVYCIMCRVAAFHNVLHFAPCHKALFLWPDPMNIDEMLIVGKLYMFRIFC